MTKEMLNLIKAIEKYTDLYYEDEDMEGNLVPDGLRTIKEIIGSLEKLEEETKKNRDRLVAKVKQEELEGRLIDISHEVLREKSFVFDGDLFFLGKALVVTHSTFMNKELTS